MASKNKLLLLLILILSLFARYSFLVSVTPKYLNSRFWNIQSIDAMKFSRDLAREKLDDQQFDKTIDKQVSLIASTGATHIAIGVPYDDEFLPIMHRWVNSARTHNLKVWFRGNLSGWEGWFGYSPIDKQTHTKKIAQFITQNSDLFEDGDLFSSCPECENGALGDPRHSGNLAEYRQFLVAETDAVRQSFRQVGKDIMANLHSMNGDVAKLVMDKETTQRLGGYVVIDHYVATPEKLLNDIKDLAKNSGGSIILGEFGAPIPDIHGKMTEQQQAAWISKSLELLVKEKSVFGLNYWTSFGGSTKIWNDDGSERQAANVVRGYFKPTQFKSQVVTWFNIPVPNAKVTEDGKDALITDKRGFFSVPISENSQLEVEKAGFNTYRAPIATDLRVYLEPEDLFIFLKTFLFSL